jgi:pilus assembly protein CpaF
MFGKRGNEGFGKSAAGLAPPPTVTSTPATPAMARPLAPEVLAEPMRDPAVQRQPVSSPTLAPQAPARRKPVRTELYYDTKSQVFSALIDTIDLSQLAKLDAESAREEIRDIVNDIITIKNFAMSISEQE